MSGTEAKRPLQREVAFHDSRASTYFIKRLSVRHASITARLLKGRKSPKRSTGSLRRACGSSVLVNR